MLASANHCPESMGAIMKRRHLVLSGVMMSTALLGCQTDPDPATAQLRKEGRSPAYVDGYKDGCQSGYFAAGDPKFKLVKDATRFNYDTQYVQGWNVGFSACKAKQQGPAG
jgi:hypothetical protein